MVKDESENIILGYVSNLTFSKAEVIESVIRVNSGTIRKRTTDILEQILKKGEVCYMPVDKYYPPGGFFFKMKKYPKNSTANASNSLEIERLLKENKLLNRLGFIDLKDLVLNRFGLTEGLNEYLKVRIDSETSNYIMELGIIVKEYTNDEYPGGIQWSEKNVVDFAPYVSAFYKHKGDKGKGYFRIVDRKFKNEFPTFR